MKTIILAAGKSDFKNKPDGLSSSQLLTIVNGRPIISWIIGDVLKKSSDDIILIMNKSDFDVQKFCYKWFSKNSRITLKTIENSPSILASILTGLDNQKTESSLRIILGDTLIIDHYQNEQDQIYISDYDDDSNVWCVVDTNKENQIISYHNKEPGLSPQLYKAVVGRYEFASLQRFKSAIRKSLDNDKKEISDAVVLYAFSKPMNAKVISSEKWIDFGHLEGIARARTKIMESRQFNSLTLHKSLPIIKKTSSNTKKLQQEIFWYSSLPLELQSLTPRILEINRKDDVEIISMEFYGYGTLTEKFLYFDLSLSFWKYVLTRLFEINSIFGEFKPEHERNINLREIYVTKTFERLESLKDQNIVWKELLSLNNLEVNGQQVLGLNKLREFLIMKSESLCKGYKPQIVHGDYCFNNILFDVSSGTVKLIDPRGNFGASENTIFGDGRYDIAKLRHSFCGYYDFIVENLFDVKYSDGKATLEIFNEYDVKSMGHQFDHLCEEYGYSVQEIRFIESLLFLSMIPLHSDSLNKQKAFFFQGVLKLNECFQGEMSENMR